MTISHMHTQNTTCNKKKKTKGGGEKKIVSRHPCAVTPDIEIEK